MKGLKLTKKYNSYPKYKDSGVKWLGSIPETWDLASTRRLFRTSKKQLKETADQYKILSLTLKGVIPRVLDGSGKNPTDYTTYQEFRKDDLVFCLFDYDVTPRTIGYVNEDGMLTGAYTRLIPKEVTYSKYYYYYFLALDFSKELLHLCTGLRNSISKPVFWTMESPLPSLEEQKKIVSFLDEKLALIDSVLQKKEKQIELLREKRSALISQAVTKGLDPETKLVDSGIKWIGKMPIEWGKANLGKILSYVQPGAYIAESIEEEDGDNKVPVLTANKGFTVGYTRDTAGIFNNPLPVIIFDDFTTSKKFVTEPFKVRSSALKILKLNGETEADLRFVYRCMEVLDFFVLEHNRHWIAMYRKEFIPFPSLRTQREIADYLDEKDRLYKKAINLIESSIISLEELRSSLISHAVTGNIKI